LVDAVWLPITDADITSEKIVHCTFLQISWFEAAIELSSHGRNLAQKNNYPANARFNIRLIERTKDSEPLRDRLRIHPH
jgi:hypothetical protein